MTTERQPRDLAKAIRRLTADRPATRPGVWYATQKEHWLGWLKEYDGPGAYGRRGRGRSAEFVYNHVVQPEMLMWLIKAAGVEPSLVAEAKEAAAKEGNLMSKSRAIRARVPWPVVERSLWARDGADERVRDGRGSRVLSVRFETTSHKSRGQFSVPQAVCDLMRLRRKARVVIEIEGAPPVHTSLKSGVEIYGREFKGMIRPATRVRVTIWRVDRA